MIWKIKRKKEPSLGDTRILAKFAWLPVDVDCFDATCRLWLEGYRETQEFQHTYPGGYWWVLVKRTSLRENVCFQARRARK
jgi:hypothetical protein